MSEKKYSWTDETEKYWKQRGNVRTCSKCKETKDISHFYRRKKFRYIVESLNYTCRECYVGIRKTARPRYATRI